MSFGSRRASVDAMRGVSIVLVLLHHFNIAYTLRDTAIAQFFGWNFLHAVVRNGNYAVTMFFVISGFLITENAYRRWGSLSNIRMLTFYRYRAGRILPCLLLLLLIVNLLAAAGIAIFRNQPEFGGPVPFWIVDVASLTFWMNVLMSYSGWLNYVLCVQWSLSIEEVFYLSFPVLCLALRRESRLLLAWSIFIVIGPVWRAMHLASEYTELNAYLSCFDGIAFGCCAAVLSRNVRLSSWSKTSAQLLVAASMCWFYLSGPIAETAVYGVTLMALGTAILLILQANTGDEKPGSMWAWLRLCGRLSYELYLFHLVVLGGLRTVWPPDEAAGNQKIPLLASYVIVSVLLALVIDKYYSEPLNRRIRTPTCSQAFNSG